MDTKEDTLEDFYSPRSIAKFKREWEAEWMPPPKRMPPPPMLTHIKPTQAAKKTIVKIPIEEDSGARVDTQEAINKRKIVRAPRRTSNIKGGRKSLRKKSSRRRKSSRKLSRRTSTSSRRKPKMYLPPEIKEFSAVSESLSCKLNSKTEKMNCQKSHQGMQCKRTKKGNIKCIEI